MKNQKHRADNHKSRRTTPRPRTQAPTMPKLAARAIFWTKRRGSQASSSTVRGEGNNKRSLYTFHPTHPTQPPGGANSLTFRRLQPTTTKQHRSDNSAAQIYALSQADGLAVAAGRIEEKSGTSFARGDKQQSTVDRKKASDGKAGQEGKRGCRGRRAWLESPSAT